MSGKRVRQTTYVHISNIAALSEAEQRCLTEAEKAAKVRQHKDYNVAKITAAKRQVSLLRYSKFFEEAFPPLRTAWTLDLLAGTVRRRRYKERGNPPILHRKELLLDPNHPRIPEYRALSKAAEEAGLFKEPTRIGFKQQWERRLEQAGLRVDGHRLVPAEDKAEEDHGGCSEA